MVRLPGMAAGARVCTTRLARVSGQYFYHQRPREVHKAARSHQFQDELTAALAGLTSGNLPA
jgi:hypothetical protein